MLSLVLLHIRPISTTETTLTVHVVIADSTRMDDITLEIKEVLRAEGIVYSTIELETTASHCHSHIALQNADIFCVDMLICFVLIC